MIIEFKGIDDSKEVRHEIEDKLVQLQSKVPSVDLDHAHALVGVIQNKTKQDKNYFRFRLVLPRVGKSALRLERKSLSMENAITRVFEGMLEQLVRGSNKMGFKSLPRLSRYKRLSKGRW